MTQEYFIEQANRGKNIFLTGYGGTGKSYILNKWKEENKHKKIVTIAPTGIAAINCGGATIHRVFKLYGDNYHIKKKPRVNFSEVDVLIIDEISMVSCEMFDFIKEAIERSCHNGLQFGGVQIIVVGDLKQLPPIYDIRIKETKERYERLLSELGGVEFIRSKAYKDGDFEIIELTIPQRSKDEKLNSILNRIRDFDMSAIKEIQSDGYTSRFYNSAVHIFPYNKQVDEYNYKQLLRLKGTQQIYKGKIDGEFNLNNIIVPEELKLKVGARIMVSKNLDNGLVNGDLGEVVELHEDFVTIYSDRFQKEYDLFPEVWKNIEFDEHGDETEIGKFTQIPLKLSFAITGHKVQGLTLDKVMFHYSSYLSNELIYVALSRATTYEGLYIIYN